MAEEIKYIGEVSPEQLTEWKAKWTNVYRFDQADPKDASIVHVTYVKKPNLMQVQRAISVASDDMLQTGITLLKDCHLGGSDKVMNDDEFMVGVSSQMPGLFQKVNADLKEV